MLAKLEQILEEGRPARTLLRVARMGSEDVNEQWER